MSDVPDAPATPEIQPGIMSSLPKTRPQRPSARRKSAQRTPRKRPAAKEQPRAPRQGFEAESEIETGAPVTPPGGVELAASVVELLGELAQSGLRSGERLLRDALLRRPST
jgi:hypothetical protein